MKRFSSFFTLLFGFLASINLAWAQSVPGVTDSEIKIGVHLSLSGPASFVGQGARVGIALAQAEIIVVLLQSLLL